MDLHTPDVRSSENLGLELMHGFAGRVIRGKVRSICRALNLGRADGEDLEQQLRLELLSRSARFDPARGTWEAFVTCVARSRSRTHFRRLKGLRKPVLVSDLNSPSGGPASIDDLGRQHRRDQQDATDQNQDVATVRTAMTPDQQLLVSLLRIHSVTETARLMGVPRTTMFERVHALRRVMGELQPYVQPDAVADRTTSRRDRRKREALSSSS